MKKKITICISLIAIGLMISMGVYQHSKKAGQKILPDKGDDIKETVSKLVKYQYDTDVKLGDVEKLTLHEEIIPVDLPLAKDSMIGRGTCENRSCTLYKNAKSYYLKQLAEYIKKEQRYSIENININGATATVKIMFKGMYLNRYIYDYESLIETFASLSTSRLNEAQDYMLKVKALEILNNNLHEYKNEDEEMYINIFLEKKSGRWHVVDISSFYNQLSGFNYESEQRNSDDKLKKINQKYDSRLKRILKNSDALLNTKDIYEIKFKGGK
ncbi:hypothetical protein [[Clostridium] innocuum]|uniref:hypothetical protein n=1 Tax=Clostridium innocuum TaxID=1522 RepID=UPI000D6C9852|nr:hypothetical protein [[Clostridium] innocuum]MCR0371665.1 hypothetical protein [[Clostridium] innocuum]MCR0561796.1 hypothetical protein [[Clostridium] innocuum]PWJ10472.1 hypothetical protein ATF84_12123 [[Clostridium] innocuum]SSA48875.1 hypothetical protein SAMN04487929_12123 [[Clostridium] innocuum]